MIAWEEEGAGPPVVFVHGLTEDRRGWDTVVALLSDSFRCVRLDLRGHGESSDADDYTALSMADDVATVVAEAAIDEPPILVGHSLGAVVVTAYATRAPARSVVNVDQSLQLGAFATALQPLASMLRGDGFHDALMGVFEALGVDQLPEPQRSWAAAHHAAARKEVVLGVWDLVLDARPEDLEELAESMLSAITVPYLAVHGSDPGPGYADWLARVVPGATVEVWDGCGHYPHLVHPEKFAQRVRELA